MMNTKLSKIIVIVGPTTSHKTKLAIKLANTFNGEIINADAYQVYADMSIGTNAPTQEEKQSAIFHLNQFLKLDDKWDIKKFKEMAEAKILELTNQNKLPIIVGGSNLYIDTLINNYQLLDLPRNSDYDNLTNQELYNRLFKLNSTIADKIGINNRKRLIRAVQIIEHTNDPDAMVKRSNPQYDFLMIECNYPTRDELYQSINSKISSMFDEGWVDEVKQLIHKYPNLDVNTNNAYKAIGYREVYDHIVNNSLLDIELIKQKVRHYAKRQITWINNKYPSHLLFKQDNESEILNKVEQWLKQ